MEIGCNGLDYIRLSYYMILPPCNEYPKVTLGRIGDTNAQSRLDITV